MINDIYQKVVAYKNGADGRFFCVMADEEQCATTGRDVSAGFMFDNCVGAVWDLVEKRETVTSNQFAAYMIYKAMDFLKEHHASLSKDDVDTFAAVAAKLLKFAAKYCTQSNTGKE